jgi:hypothetical protein
MTTDIDSNTNEWWDTNTPPQEKTPPTTTIYGSTYDNNPPYEFVEQYKIKHGHSLLGGRGVFATDDIEEGELIERCPIVPLQLRSKKQQDGAIWSYCYTKPLCECEECKTNGFIFYMVLGHGMVYNHQDDNTADMRFNHKDLYVDIVANRPIKKNEEIFVTYGSTYFNSRPKVIVEKLKNAE